MKKFLGILILGLLWCNIGFAAKYLDAYTLDKKKIENEVIKTLSTKNSKLTKYKNWEGKLELYKVTKPNITFFSASMLEEQSKKYPKKFSKNCFTQTLLDLQPTLEIKGHMWKPDGHFLTQFNYTAEYDQLMNQGLTNWLDTQNREPLELIKEKLLKWANGKSFSHLYPDTDNQAGYSWGYIDTFWNLRATLTSIIIAYATLSELEIFSETEKKKVQNWLEFLVTASASQKNDGSKDRLPTGIHTELQKAFIYTLWGVADGNDKYFQAGIKGFLLGLSVTRKDGSHKFEVRNVKDASKRNERGLEKMNQVVGYMVIIAEMAKLQDYNLYDIQTKKKVNLHKMIEFLSKGWSDKTIKLKYLVSKYADKRFAYRLSGNANSIAWSIPYIFNNNFNNNSIPIITKWIESLPENKKNYINDFGFGGSQGCYYADKIQIF